MSIQSEINRIKSERDAQTTDLASIESQLAEALTLLENKAAGGGGGSAVETCTVTIMPPFAPIREGDVLIVAVSPELEVIEFDVSIPASYQILKNSIIVNSSENVDISGNAEFIISSGALIADRTNIFAAGDFTYQYVG